MRCPEWANMSSFGVSASSDLQPGAADLAREVIVFLDPLRDTGVPHDSLLNSDGPRGRIDAAGWRAFCVRKLSSELFPTLDLFEDEAADDRPVNARFRPAFGNHEQAVVAIPGGR